MRKIWQLLQRRNWKWMAAGGVGLLALAAVVMISGNSDETMPETTVSDMTESSVADTDGEISAELVEVFVSEEEAELLSSLYDAMEDSDYDRAAALLNDHEEQFVVLAEETLEGNMYYYIEEAPEEPAMETSEEEEEPIAKKNIAKMGQMQLESTFYGMVLTRYNTVFFGEFSDGKPNGEVAAIQTMILDQPRYSYAEGVWRDGKLNGEGIAGYYYYQDAPETGFVRVEKRGDYRDNLLDSDFVYETESGSGEQLSWEMKAVAGVTVITQTWEHYPYRKEYMLGSVEDSSRAYVLSEDKVTAVLWNNLIVWPE